MSTFMDHIHRVPLVQPKVGDRVEVPAYTDAWMRGDRYGTVTRFHPAWPSPDLTVRPNPRGRVSVALDKSGCVHRFIANDCTVVAS